MPLSLCPAYPDYQREVNEHEKYGQERLKMPDSGMTRTIISWNVNGLRQRYQMNEFLPLFRHNPDIVCIQEAKTVREKIPDELKKLHGYFLFCAPVPAGSFTETLLFSRERPLSVRYRFGKCPFDTEGRVIVAEYPAFVLLSIYFPLGVMLADTLAHKLAFYDAFLDYAAHLRERGCPVIVCGDFSIAHTDDDVESVKKHASRQVGTTSAEREKMDTLVRAGFTDVLRQFRQGKGQYTWWPNGFAAHERHLGRRLDYFFVNEPVKPGIVSTDILTGIEGSDHCPILLELKT
jgi:exodeoxyribonuclease III